MENELTNDVKALSEEVADLKRSVDLIPTHTGSVEKRYFNSVGEYAKSLAAREDKALELFGLADELKIEERNATTAQSIVLDSWLGDLSKIIDRGRPTVSAFSQQALPATGLNLEYGQVKPGFGNIDTEEQLAELDDLNYGQIELETKSVPVKTWGSWTGASLQTISRSSVSYLDTAFKAMAVGYAKKINKELVNLVEGADYTNYTVTKSGTDAEAWVRAIAETAQVINDAQASSLDFLLVAPDAFVDIIAIVDQNGRADLAANNPVNNIGSANVAGLSGSVLNVPIIIESELAAGSIYGASSDAWTTYESSGAPVRLQDENVINLSKQFSLYGMGAFANPYPGSVVKVV